MLEFLGHWGFGVLGNLTCSGCGETGELSLKSASAVGVIAVGHKCSVGLER